MDRYVYMLLRLLEGWTDSGSARKGSFEESAVVRHRRIEVMVRTEKGRPLRIDVVRTGILRSMALQRRDDTHILYNAFRVCIRRTIQTDHDATVTVLIPMS